MRYDGLDAELERNRGRFSLVGLVFPGRTALAVWETLGLVRKQADRGPVCKLLCCGSVGGSGLPMGWVGQCQQALGTGDAPGCLARGSLGVQLQASGGPECEGPCGRCPGAAAQHVELTFQRF